MGSRQERPTRNENIYIKWVKASKLECDEVRDESRRTKMITIINSHDNH